jgi:hypothetical protein
MVALTLVACTAIGGFALAGCGAPVATTDGDDAEVISFHDEGLLGNDLTRAQVQTVLKLIDDICGDTWCEGDNDFRFRYLLCEADAGACTLLLQTAARDGATSSPSWRWHVCRTPGFVGFDSLVNTTSGGYQWLTDSYYEALSTCIDRLETDIAGR